MTYRYSEHLKSYVDLGITFYQIGPFCEIGKSPHGIVKNSLAIGLYSVIRSRTTIYDGCNIGKHFMTGHSVLIRENCEIGDNVSIGTHTEIGPDVIIGNDVRIHSNCFIPELTVIEDGAWIGPCVCICNDRYPGNCGSPKYLEGVTIQTKATIGANVTILPGVVVGYSSVVGAGSVVTKNVPHGITVYGNPARATEEER